MKKIFLFLIFFYFSLNAISQETLKDCDFCPEMVKVEPGKFTMGSSLEESGHTDEKPQREVNINYGFAVSKYEITYNVWDLCQNDGACPKSDDAGFGRDNYPVINISWNDANTFISWLNQKSNQKYRLLTEAEFEYVARGGTTDIWYWGPPSRPEVASQGSKDGCKFANLHDEDSKDVHFMYVWANHPCRDGYPENAPVGQFKENPFGLFDILGNVREWVQDCHKEGYDGAPVDGSVRKHDGNCEARVVRGGGWMDGPYTARAAYRYSEKEDMKNTMTGFRIAREI